MVRLGLVPVLQTPPGKGGLKSVAELPRHTSLGPTMVVAVGTGFTVTSAMAKQPVGRIYEIVAVPVLIPMVCPLGINMNATDGVALLQVPPGVALVSITVSPLQNDNGPPIGAGFGLTVNTTTRGQLDGNV